MDLQSLLHNSYKRSQILPLIFPKWFLVFKQQQKVRYIKCVFLNVRMVQWKNIKKYIIMILRFSFPRSRTKEKALHQFLTHERKDGKKTENEKKKSLSDLTVKKKVLLIFYARVFFLCCSVCYVYTYLMLQLKGNGF